LLGWLRNPCIHAAHRFVVILTAASLPDDVRDRAQTCHKNTDNKEHNSCADLNSDWWWLSWV